MARKPSKAQLAALRLVDEANRKNNGMCAPSGYKRRFNPRTILALYQNDWIEYHYLPNVFGGLVRLTEAGRDVLRRYDEGGDSNR